MVFIATPKAATRIPLAETRMFFKHSSCTPRLQHNLCILDRILVGQINLEMNMIASKTKILEFKTKFFEFKKSLDAGVDVRLLPETVIPIPVLSDKNHGHPVIWVSPEIFLELPLLTFFKLNTSCRTDRGQARSGLPRTTYFRKRYSEKSYRPFISGLSLHSVPQYSRSKK